MNIKNHIGKLIVGIIIIVILLNSGIFSRISEGSIKDQMSRMANAFFSTKYINGADVKIKKYSVPPVILKLDNVQTQKLFRLLEENPIYPTKMRETPDFSYTFTFEDDLMAFKLFVFLVEGEDIRFEIFEKGKSLSVSSHASKNFEEFETFLLSLHE